MTAPVIIRLQNLPLEARSIDIRKFFDGLIIPDGGVHIVGGERGDAFIAFQSDEDARQAMTKDGHILYNAIIRLNKSSKTEMQNVIAAARTQLAAQKSTIKQPTQIIQQTPITTTNTNDLLTSLSKIINTTSNSSIPSTSTLTSTTTINSTSLSHSLIDQLKNINGLISSKQSPPPPPQNQQLQVSSVSNTNLPSVLADFLKTSSVSSSLPSIEQPKLQQQSNLDINKLLSILSNSNSSQTSQKQQLSPQHQQQSVYNRYQTKPSSTTATNGDGLLPLPVTDNSNNERRAQKRSYDSLNKSPSLTNTSNKASLLPTPSQNDEQHFYVKVANFHNTCSFKDIRTFLQGVHVEHDSIKLLTDSNGNRNGSALVRLQNLVDVKKALLKNGQYFDSRTIEVTQVNSNGPEGRRASFEMTPSNTSNNELPGFYVKIYGLPQNVSRSILLDEFNNVKFKRINKVVNNEGKIKFICEVETKLDLERALTRQNEVVGGRKIQIYEMSRFEFDQEFAISQPAFMNENDTLNNNDRESSDDTCVLMSDIPYSAREYDVKYFFQNYNIAKINLLVDQQTQKPTGDCCVCFVTRDERDRAIRDKDDQSFRNRTIRVKPITNVEYEKLIQSNSQQQQQQRPVLLPTPGYSADDNINIQQLVDDNDLNGQHDDEYENGHQKNRQNNRQRYGGSNGRYGQNRSQQSSNNKRSYNSNYENQAKRARTINTEDLPPLPPDLQQYNSLVLLSNVNYNATREDILEVIKNFNPIADTLKIRHTDYGKPTGDAIVAFKTLDDAMNATNQMNGSNFMGRTLKANVYNNSINR